MTKTTPTHAPPPPSAAGPRDPAALPHITFDGLPQREKKQARTRLGLLDALVSRLDARPLEDVSIKELADEVGVSQGTVFNHFANKGELLTYFIVLWGIEVGLLGHRVVASHSSVHAALGALLSSTAAQVSAHPGVMLEIIAHQARMPEKPALPEISRGERLLRFGVQPGVLTQPAGGLEIVLPQLLNRAVASGELPPHADVSQLTLALASVFFGVPLLLARRQPEAIGPCYDAQLALLWAGARARPG